MTEEIRKGSCRFVHLITEPMGTAEDSRSTSISPALTELLV